MTDVELTEPYFDPSPDRTLVWGEHDLASILHGEAEVDLSSGTIPSVEIFGFFVRYDGHDVTVQTDGYVRPVAEFEPGTYDDVQSFISDAYGWRLEINHMDVDDRVETFGRMTHDEDRAEQDGHIYVPDPQLPSLRFPSHTMRLNAYALSHADETALSDAHVASLETRYSEGDMVLYENGNRVATVLEVMTEPFEWEDTDGLDDKLVTEDGMVDASEDSPTYLLAVETGGARPFKATGLDKMPSEEGERFQERAEKHLKQLDQAEMEAIVEAVAEDGEVEIEELDGFTTWPDPWKEADKPARLIAAEVWNTEFRRNFETCVRKMRADVRDPKGFCAALKTEVEGPGWREGDDD